MANPFELFFREYASAFNEFDPERIASLFHCPCLIVNHESVAQFATREAVRENMRGVCAYHRAEGYGRASVVDLSARLIANNLALVDVQWRVVRADGSHLWAWKLTYNLVDHGDGWKIYVATTHEEFITG